MPVPAVARSPPVLSPAAVIEHEIAQGERFEGVGQPEPCASQSQPPDQRRRRRLSRRLNQVVTELPIAGAKIQRGKRARKMKHSPCP
jgi:hypothetical protein